MHATRVQSAVVQCRRYRWFYFYQPNELFPEIHYPANGPALQRCLIIGKKARLSSLTNFAKNVQNVANYSLSLSPCIFSLRAATYSLRATGCSLSVIAIEMEDGSLAARDASPYQIRISSR